MAVSKVSFGSTKKGEEATLFCITNKQGMEVKVTDYGVNIVSIMIPDANGNKTDVVLGYDNIAQYEDNECFFGSTIGPSANRVADAAFKIHGQTYKIAVNDGKNNLHSDMELGYHKRIWASTEIDNGVIFELEDPATMGFPGNKKIKVVFTLTEDNEVKLDYAATSDEDTLINLTNHVYFNLAGHDQGTIVDHKLQLKASNYTPVVAGSIPTGEIATVKGTPFDFLASTTIGDRIDADDQQIKFGQGYDHNWVIDECDGSVKMIAEVEDPATKRKMQVYSDQPGIQFYAGNCISAHTGKNQAQYGKRTGFALETQAFPNSINQDNFPDVVYGPNRPYATTTIYKFIW